MSKALSSESLFGGCLLRLHHSPIVVLLGRPPGALILDSGRGGGGGGGGDRGRGGRSGGGGCDRSPFELVHPFQFPIANRMVSRDQVQTEPPTKLLSSHNLRFCPPYNRSSRRTEKQVSQTNPERSTKATYSGQPKAEIHLTKLCVLVHMQTDLHVKDVEIVPLLDNDGLQQIKQSARACLMGKKQGDILYLSSS